MSPSAYAINRFGASVSRRTFSTGARIRRDLSRSLQFRIALSHRLTIHTARPGGLSKRSDTDTAAPTRRIYFRTGVLLPSRFWVVDLSPRCHGSSREMRDIGVERTLGDVSIQRSEWRACAVPRSSVGHFVVLHMNILIWQLTDVLTAPLFPVKRIMAR